MFCYKTDTQHLVRFNYELLPKIEDVLHPNNITSVQVSPIEGVYTISAVPIMNPPPTHVAAGWINTEKIFNESSYLGKKRSISHLEFAVRSGGGR